MGRFTISFYFCFVALLAPAQTPTSADYFEAKVRPILASNSAAVITLPAAKRCHWFKVTVDSVYKGSKWNDLAVSEFHVLSQDP
jgi:hypothetical protein